MLWHVLCACFLAGLLFSSVQIPSTCDFDLDFMLTLAACSLQLALFWTCIVIFHLFLSSLLHLLVFYLHHIFDLALTFVMTPFMVGVQRIKHPPFNSLPHKLIFLKFLPFDLRDIFPFKISKLIPYLACRVPTSLFADQHLQKIQIYNFPLAFGFITPQKFSFWAYFSKNLLWPLLFGPLRIKPIRASSHVILHFIFHLSAKGWGRDFAFIF